MGPSDSKPGDVGSNVAEVVFENDPGAFLDTPRYRKLAFLGRGAMGVVYRVHDEETGLDVALKTLPSPAPDRVYDLKREFRSLAGIGHRNLVALHELFVEGKVCAITMEYVDGVPFTDHLASLRSADEHAFAEPGLTAALDAAAQLAAGIAALHASGKVHRDIKPTNVLVARDGRVVILDFGLSFALEDLRSPGGDPHELVGTFSYMAPEQMWGKTPDPAADWYAFGVVLYEALTGRLPFADGAEAALLGQPGAGPPRVADLVEGIPERVDRLVAALLEREPAARPRAAQILDALSGNGATGTEQQWQAPASYDFEHAFVGREAELAQLHELQSRVGPGVAVVAQVQGPSGIGKTELIKRFSVEMRKDPRALVLHGRCHPRESIPYKAIDAVIDGLADAMLSLSEEERQGVIPEHGAALARLFPVLERVPGLRALPAEEEPPEPFELRRRAVAALRELLSRLCELRDVVMWIDDLQWADRDGASVIREIVRPPRAPSLMLVLSYRSEDRPRVVELLQEDSLDAASALPPQVISVGPLGEAEARKLASHTVARLGGDHLADSQAATIIAEADGSPFFIGELARAAARAEPDSLEPDAAPRALRLNEVLANRLGRLGGRERTLLEVIAVAGWPLTRSAALVAAMLGESERPLLAALENASLVRETTIGDGSAFEVYHDRIRESVLDSLTAETRRVRHRAIAETLRRIPDPDPHALFEHFLGAGERDLARGYALSAAKLASAALAFDRAANLYRSALDLELPDSERHEVLSQLGEALQGAGRGIDAAENFERAAAVLVSGDADRRLALLRRASEQFVRSGSIDRGIRLLHSFLSELGIRLPRSPRTAMVASVLQRARFLMRKPDAALAVIPAFSSRDRLELESLWSAAASLTMVDPILGDAISVRGLLKAMDLGDRAYVIRGLGLEAAREAAFGGRFFTRRSFRLIETIQSLAQLGGEPYDLAWAHQSVGATAYLAGNWRTASEECGRAVTMWRSRCVGAAWEISTAESFELSALAYQGQIASLARRLPDAIADGDRRDDVYASSGFCMGILNLLWLAEDRPLDGRRNNDDAIARWPRDRFLLQHFLHLVGATQSDLYVGQAELALDRILGAWPAMRRAQLLALGTARIEILHLRARAALAGAASGGTAVARSAPTRRRGSHNRADLLRIASRDARRLDRETMPQARMFAAAIRAGIAALDGDVETASDRLATTIDASETAAMGLYGAAARMARGRLIGGNEGDLLCAEGERWMREQSVVSPSAMAAMLLPGTIACS